MALLLAAFAVSFGAEALLPAILTGLLAMGVAAMALTGFCPEDWLRIRAERSSVEGPFGFPDGREFLEQPPADR